MKRGRGRSQIESTRPLLLVPALLLAIVMNAGCNEREWSHEFDRQPMAVVAHEGETVFAHAGGALTIVVEPSTVVQIGDRILCMAPAPGDGFLVFCERTLIHVRHRDGVWGAREASPIDHTVRQALPLDDDRLALLTAGDTSAGPGEPPAEPAPWLRGGLIRLAWLEGDRLVVGGPELDAEVNAYRLKAGRFGGEDENLLVFVYTRAPFDEVRRPRPWIYRVIEGEDGVPHLEPRWRGTSFSRPFRDATFGDFTGEGEGDVAALEIARDGGRLLTAYRFKGFGLEGLAPSIELSEVEDRLEVIPRDGRGDELIARATDGRFLLFALDTEDEMLREVRVIEGPGEVRGWMIAPTDRDTAGLFCVLPGGATWRAGLDE